MQSESAESTDLEESLLSRLQCTQCKRYMVPPIMLCVKGHKTCMECKENCNWCLSCNNSFLDIRNLALEDLARKVNYPCKYRDYGCTEVYKHDTIDGHQVKCQYIPQRCPAAELARQTCDWTGSYSDIKGHLKENHPDHFCEYVEGDFRFIYKLTANKRWFSFIFAYNEIFFSSFLDENNIFYAVVLYVGPAENAAKYKYRVELVNKDNTEGVTVICLTRSSDEKLQDVCRSGNCGKLHYDMVKRLMDEKSNLKYKLDIIRVGNCVINAV